MNLSLIIPLASIVIIALLFIVLFILYRMTIGIKSQYTEEEQADKALRDKQQEEHHQQQIQQLTTITALETELVLLKEEKNEEEQELTKQKAEYLAELNAHQISKQLIERLETTLASERNNSQEKLNLLNSAQETLKQEFQNLANSILDEKSAKFTEQNQLNLTSIMSPLREQISEFKKKVEDTYDKESKDRISLFEQVKQLQELNSQLSEDAHNLTSALKGSSKTQGNWGELILERILEQSGLEKGREYETQSSFSKADIDSKQKRYQPDVLIHLPEKKTIVVDSKVSLTAYERFCSTSDDNEKSTALKAHITAVRARVNELSDKNYQDIDGLNTLDFVVMFMPIEAAFLIAMQTDQNLYQYAMGKNIFIVSPSNLLVMLRVINHTWRNEKQNQNAQQIADNAGKLYDKFVGFVDDMDDLGKKISQTQKSWDNGMNKLQQGSGNLIKRAEELKKLGAKANKSLPDNVLDKLP